MPDTICVLHASDSVHNRSSHACGIIHGSIGGSHPASGQYAVMKTERAPLLERSRELPTRWLKERDGTTEGSDSKGVEEHVDGQRGCDGAESSQRGDPASGVCSVFLCWHADEADR
ncbi:hypothetical protein Q8A73_022116 [Channa argus]|nr:hypothetical protein Q8A73_022116 [Channa argus]